MLEGGKMSKSKGNVIDLCAYRQVWVDAVRYYLLKEMTMEWMVIIRGYAGKPY